MEIVMIVRETKESFLLRNTLIGATLGGAVMFGYGVLHLDAFKEDSVTSAWHAASELSVMANALKARGLSIYLDKHQAAFMTCVHEVVAKTDKNISAVVNSNEAILSSAILNLDQMSDCLRDQGSQQEASATRDARNEAYFVQATIGICLGGLLGAGSSVIMGLTRPSPGQRREKRLNAYRP